MSKSAQRRAPRPRAFGLSLATAALCWLGGAGPAAAAAPAPSDRLCIYEPSAFKSEPPDAMRRRFDLYKSLGIGMLRDSWGWRGLETKSGAWELPDRMRYFAAAHAAGMRLKLTLDDINAAPGWYMLAHPEARNRDKGGHLDESSLSIWAPGLRDLLDDKMDHEVQLLARSGVLGDIDFLVVGLGPAGEPRYPAPWLAGQPRGQNTRSFWYYNASARDDFVATMQKRYPSIGAANAAWRTNFASWGAVALPDVGERSGIWRDMLPWYRDSKRDFIEWQIDDVAKKLAKYGGDKKPPQLVIFVPGVQAPDSLWRQAEATGDPSVGVMYGSDTDFLIEEARRHGLWMQATGVEAEGDVIYVKKYMAAHHFSIPIWGENAGGAPALNPGHLADVVIRQDLEGLDYIAADQILKPDGVSPTPTYPAFAAAMGRLKDHFAGR